MKHIVKATCVAFLITTSSALATDFKHKDAEKAFTVFPVFTMNLERIQSVTYGFIVKKKAFSSEGDEGFDVKVKTVTKNSDGSTKKLPYPNYPHHEFYEVVCNYPAMTDDLTYTPSHLMPQGPGPGPQYIDPEAIKAGVGPTATDERSFYYDLWWAVCKKEYRSFTNDFYKSLN